jgi:hypothetical protein
MVLAARKPLVEAAQGLEGLAAHQEALVAKR